MKTAFTPWSDLMLGQATPLQRAAWFVLGSVEREQWLNLDALTSYWLRAPMAWLPPSRPSRPATVASTASAPTAKATPRRRTPARAVGGPRQAAASARHAHRSRRVEPARGAGGEPGVAALARGEKRLELV